MRTSRSIGVLGSVSMREAFLPSFAFRGCLQSLDPGVPKCFQVFAGLCQPFRPRPVEPPGTFTAFGHQPGIPQDLQVLGDRRPRYLALEPRGDLAGPHLPLPYQRQDLPAAGFCDGLKRCIHGARVTTNLRK